MATWDERYSQGNTPWDGGRAFVPLLDLVDRGVVSPGRCLELGCGLGWNVLALAERGFDCVGVDLSETAVQRAKQTSMELASQAAREGRTPPRVVRMFAADVFALDSDKMADGDDELFDCIVDEQCFHVIRGYDGGGSEREAAYAQVIARFLRPGGCFVLITGNANEPRRNPGPVALSLEDATAPFLSFLTVELAEEVRLDCQEFRDTEQPLGWLLVLRRAQTEPAPFNFASLSRSEDLGVFGAAGPTLDNATDWCAYMTSEGITSVLSLLRDDENGEELASAVRAQALPVVRVPGEGRRYKQLAVEALSGCRSVVVHCQAGQQRTGAVLASFLVSASSTTISERRAERIIRTEAAFQGAVRLPAS